MTLLFRIIFSDSILCRHVSPSEWQFHCPRALDLQKNSR